MDLSLFRLINYPACDGLYEVIMMILGQDVHKEFMTILLAI